MEVNCCCITGGRFFCNIDSSDITKEPSPCYTPVTRNYINGFKKPSAERESEILAHIHKLGKEMIAACF